ncbi:unnamed protein product [Rhizophagus irregularis]|nr:unnamed protein product [Rhizophagus irregularis]
MKHWPFKVINKNGKPVINVEYKGKRKDFTPEEILSMILIKMKEIAEAFLGTQVKNAVITVPACFNDSQRQAIKDAGLIASLGVLRIITGPTAAAITYSLNVPFYNSPFYEFYERSSSLSRAGLIPALASAGPFLIPIVTIGGIAWMFFEYNGLNKKTTRELNILVFDLGDNSINPSGATAYGAAVQAAILSGDTSEKTQDLLLLDVAPLSLGERTRTRDYNLLGELELSEISPAPRGVPQIKVTFDIDANGILNVSAVDKTTGRPNKITVTYDKGRLSKEKIMRMVNEAKIYHAERAERCLKSYAYNLLNVAQNIDNIKNELHDAALRSMAWLENNREAKKDEREREQKLLKEIVDQIMNKLNNA